MTGLIVTLTMVVVTGCSASRPTAQSRSGPRGSTIGPLALGVNVAAWDGIYSGNQAVSIDALLRSAGIQLLRYPGGSWADEYDIRTNLDTSKCGGNVALSCMA